MEAGDAPDIVDFPQPGLMATFARQGKIIPTTDQVPDAWLAKNYLQSWRDMGTVDGTEYGVWHRFNAKSLVWYPKKAFEAAGYAVPTTWDELKALEEQIVSDGDTPWCVGIESGAATGWPATDWTEEFMLRTTSLENYDKWVAGTLPFSSPEVKNAIETFAEIWNNGDMVNGGTAGHRHHLLRRFPRPPCSRIRPAAGCTSRATSSPPSSRPRRLRRGLRRLLPARRGRRSTASPSSWPATSWPPPRIGLKYAP